LVWRARGTVTIVPALPPAMEAAMQPRIDTRHVSRDAYQAMLSLQSYVESTGLDKSLQALVKIRASQINGCAFCLHMHLPDARKDGESQERLDLLSAWREAPVFTARERAALAWTEAVTLVADSHVPDDVYEAARAESSERELLDLTMAVVAINGWNRLMVSFRVPPAVTKSR
jgi:AhpD family alkylhydroperoxidase